MHKLAVFATLYNNSLTVLEWVEHYKNQGVDHIYLVDIGSSDNYFKVLQKYIESGFLTIYLLPGKKFATHHINLAIKQRAAEIEWVIISKINQYWYGTKNTIKDFLLQSDTKGMSRIYTHEYAFPSPKLEKKQSNIRKEYTIRHKNLYSEQCIVRVSSLIGVDEENYVLNVENDAFILDYENIKINYYIDTSRISNASQDDSNIDINEIEDLTLANLI